MRDEYIFLFVSLAVFFAALIIRRLTGIHAEKRRKARKIYRELQTIEDSAERFRIMRRMDAYAFEELVIHALRKHGYLSWHGSRYSGDGGIDGYVLIHGQISLLQDKRYSYDINPSHVSAFALLCRRRRKTGYFIHTGRTRKASWEAARNSMVRILSGERLLLLIDKNSNFNLEDK